MDDRVYFPHSLGMFYQALTQYLGFPNYGDEYKVMGLAPYGEPKLPRCDASNCRVCRAMEASRLNLAATSATRGKRSSTNGSRARQASVTLFTPALESLLGPARDKDWRPLEQTSQGRRAVGAGDVRRGFFPSAQRPASQVSGGENGMRGGWLRHEFGSERKDHAEDAVHAGLRAVGRRRCGRRDRRCIWRSGIDAAVAYVGPPMDCTPISARDCDVMLTIAQRYVQDNAQRISGCWMHG
ncbi:MAG: carbamoyltransferase N-terminal domain-containing protein [Candidatus Nanopelagicales bacterium]